MAKLLTEFLGTMFLVLAIGLAVAHAGAWAPLAIGLMLMVMVYMGGPISGAHYNPAVTLGVLLRGGIPIAPALLYWVVQVLGAMAGAYVSWRLTGKTFAPAPGEGVSAMTACVVEMIFTFALALVVLNVATVKRTEGNSYYGLAIGMTVTAAALIAGPISGGAFNPAVGTGPAIIRALVDKGSMGGAWVHVVGPFAGGLVAALVFRVQHNVAKEGGA